MPSSSNSTLRHMIWILSGLSALFVIIWQSNSLYAVEGLASYLPLHMAAETFSIVISMMVFGVAWNVYSAERPGNIIILACALLAVGFIDFAHMLSFKGMPDFITPSGPEKAINYWLSARLIAALALLAIALRPWKPLHDPSNRYGLLAGSLFISAGVIWLWLAYPQVWPRTFIAGQGLTSFKIDAEYVIIAILLVPAVLFYRYARQPQSYDAASLFAATAITILSELCFTLYSDVSDIFNLLGHAYKIIAYIFIYRAVFTGSVREPYLRLDSEFSVNRQIAKELRSASLYTRSLIEANPDPLVTISVQGKITDVNHATEVATGRNRSELIGTDFSEYFTEPDKAREGYQQAFQKGAINDYPLTLRHQDGHVTDVLYNAGIYRNEAGDVAGVFASARDITELHASELLRTQLAAIVEFSNDAIIGKSTEGIITSWNKGAERMYGYSFEEIVGKHISVLAPALHDDEISGFLEKVRNGEVIANYETERIRKDGALIQVSLTLSPIKDVSGNIVGVSTFARDITERKQAELKLSENEQAFRKLAENSPDVIVRYDREGRRIYVNPEFERVNHITAREVYGKKPLELSTELKPKADAFTEKLMAAMESGTVSKIDLSWDTNGHQVSWYVRIVPEFDADGKVVSALTIWSDITERKRVEEDLRLSTEALKEAQRIAHLGSWYVDLATNQVFWSEELYKMYGFDPALPPPLLTESAKLFTPESWERLSAAIARAVETGMPYELELEMMPKTGSSGWMLARGELVRDVQGKAVRIRGVVMDITARKLAEEKLAFSEEKFSTAFQASPNLMAITNPEDGRIFEINESFTRFFGYTREECIGRKTSELGMWVDPEQRKLALRMLEEKGAALYVPVDLRTKSGEIRSVIDSLVFITLNNKKYLLSVATDVTERKQAEEELLESEERFRSLVEQSPLSIQVLSPEGQTLQVNHGFESLWGITLADLKNYNLLEDQQLVRLGIMPYIQRAFAGEASAIPAAEYDTPATLGVGTKRWVQSNIYPVKDKSGNIRQVILIHEDITQRKKAEVALLENEARLRTLFQTIPDLMWLKDAQGVYLSCNPAFEQLYGAKESEIVGKTDYDFVDKDLADFFRAKDKLALASDEPRMNEEWLTFASDGHRSLVQTTKIAMHDHNGKLVGVLGIARDITELKQMEDEIKALNRDLEQRVAERTEQLEAANKELESFSYSVSHDLRTPLRAIDGFSHILLDDYTDRLDDEGKRLLKVIRDNTGRMGQLIDDILQFSRTGRLELTFSEIDMEKLAHEVIEELRPVAANVKLQLEIDPLPRAMGDRAMMHQVFVNLLSNAIKFSRNKDVPVIHVGVSIAQDEVVYHVKDNGVGFDMQYQNKLFGVFQRLHSINEFEGTGIGLAIVKRIITRHGGRVWAEGKVNEGATVYFALPVREKNNG